MSKIEKIEKTAKIPKMKDYYKNKSMPMRYTIFGFLALLAIIQLILPSWKHYFEQKEQQVVTQAKITKFYEKEAREPEIEELKLLSLWNYSPLLISKQNFQKVVILPLLLEKKKNTLLILLSI